MPQQQAGSIENPAHCITTASRIEMLVLLIYLKNVVLDAIREEAAKLLGVDELGRSALGSSSSSPTVAPMRTSGVTVTGTCPVAHWWRRTLWRISPVPASNGMAIAQQQPPAPSLQSKQILASDHSCLPRWQERVALVEGLQHLVLQELSWSWRDLCTIYCSYSYYK